MSKDYKNVPRKNDDSAGTSGGILPFLTGLVVGLFIAFIVFLNLSDSSYKPFQTQQGALPEAPALKTADSGAADEQISALPVPKFDFYNILPNKEINISEWVAEEKTIQAAVRQDEDSVYILQVGSFKQLEAADQVKAQLALLGISADIQRVVINGQDTRYRVRIGPYKDQKSLTEESRRLQQNNLEFMLLKLQADDPG